MKKNTRKYAFCFCMLFAIVPSSVVNAQNADDLPAKIFYYRLDGAYVFGGQVYNDQFTYDPGISVQAIVGKMLSDHVGAGMGIGYQHFKDEGFAPLFLEALGIKKNKPTSPFVKMHLGYAPAINHEPLSMKGYSKKGGMYFDAGVGRRFLINQNLSVIFHVSYRHQFGEIEYTSTTGSIYSDDINYDMLVISVGVEFRN